MSQIDTLTLCCSYLQDVHDCGAAGHPARSGHPGLDNDTQTLLHAHQRARLDPQRGGGIRELQRKVHESLGSHNPDAGRCFVSR